MTTLLSEPVASLLDRLHREGDAADRAHREEMMSAINAPGATLEKLVQDFLVKERSDYRAYTQEVADNFLAVSPAYGRFLYATVRASSAKRIVEFGTSMGLSAIYLAAALRDNGGGRLISAEFEPSKVARARSNLEAAGLADLVEVREGDARETLNDVDGTIDLLHLDGAFSLYLDVLKRVEPSLAVGAIVLGENAFDPDYLAYVRDPAHGYMSQGFSLDEARGNDFAVKIA